MPRQPRIITKTVKELDYVRKELGAYAAAVNTLAARLTVLRMALNAVDARETKPDPSLRPKRKRAK